MLEIDGLRGLLGRLLGWARERAIDDALASVDLAATGRAHLVVCGEGDLVPIAYAIHRRTLGADRPFIVCDPRRGNTPASVRSPANQGSSIAALAVARGGSLCVRQSRLPRDFSAVASELRAAGVQYIVCADDDDVHPLLVVPAPIRVPSLRARENDLPRIVDEYAAEAAATLEVRGRSFREDERAWVIEHAASSLSEIEKTTLRLVALSTSASVSSAAARLGMAPVSLSRWIGRRKPGVCPAEVMERSRGVRGRS